MQWALSGLDARRHCARVRAPRVPRGLRPSSSSSPSSSTVPGRWTTSCPASASPAMPSAAWCAATPVPCSASVPARPLATPGRAPLSASRLPSRSTSWAPPQRPPRTICSTSSPSSPQASSPSPPMAHPPSPTPTCPGSSTTTAPAASSVDSSRASFPSWAPLTTSACGPARMCCGTPPRSPAIPRVHSWSVNLRCWWHATSPSVHSRPPTATLCCRFLQRGWRPTCSHRLQEARQQGSNPSSSPPSPHPRADSTSSSSTRPISTPRSVGAPATSSSPSTSRPTPSTAIAPAGRPPPRSTCTATACGSSPTASTAHPRAVDEAAAPWRLSTRSSPACTRGAGAWPHMS